MPGVNNPAVDADDAFAERCAISGAPSGPLARLKFAVKDNVAVEGALWSAGHPLFANRRGETTAPAVRRLLDAGADLVGMTETDGGAFGAVTPQTKNPRYPGLIVGGSSGGSAAAVAAGCCDFAVGTDTGGSVRIPSACTGLFAFKPTFGRIPVEGVWPLAGTMDHVGLIARDLSTLAKAGEAMIATSPREDAGELRIMIESDDDGLWHPSVSEAVDRLADALVGSGHEVTRQPVPDREAIAEAHGILVLSEAALVYSDLTEEQFDRLGEAARRALRHAGTITESMISDASDLRMEAGHWANVTMRRFDCVLSPTLPVPVPPVGTRRIMIGGVERPVVVAMTFLTCLANLTGKPTIVMPIGTAKDAPPFSLQITGAVGADEELFGMAARIAADLSGCAIFE